MSNNELKSPPAAASAGAKDEDAHLAQSLVTLDQLINVYGFEASVAQQAIDAVGFSDLNLCYNFILDQGLAEDKGGPVYPVHTCPHVSHRVQITLDKLPPKPEETRCQFVAATAKSTGGLKGEANEDGTCPGTENWLCLTCGDMRCSRYVNGHGLQHWQETRNQPETDSPEDAFGHCIAVSLTDLSVWCHVCNAYIISDTYLKNILQTLEQRKFPSQPEEDPSPSLLQSASSASPLLEPPQAKRHRTGSLGRDYLVVEEDEDSGRDEENEDEDVEDEEGSSTNHAQNGEEGDEDENDAESLDASEESALYQLIAEAAASQGIPLPFFLSQIRGAPLETEETGPVDYPFEKLPKSLSEMAEFILSDKCQRILVLAGAGMSVASGIPDFRSADGLYATLDANRLTCTTEEQRDLIRKDPSAALDQHLFLDNPLPCLESQREFILGTRQRRWKATLAHRFVELLHHKTGKLVRLYTQNIDGLEDQCANLPGDRVIAVHGSMDRAECARCEAMQDFDQFCEKVQAQIKDLTLQDANAPNESTPILCEKCGNPAVKPAIVLFRSSLPKVFFEKVTEDVKDVDLLIVIGTSLSVAPANSLVWRVPRSAMRLVVNREKVGRRLGIQYDDEAERDYFARGDIDPVLLQMTEELGWLEDLRPLMGGSLPASSEELLRARLEGSKMNDHVD